MNFSGEALHILISQYKLMNFNFYFVQTTFPLTFNVNFPYLFFFFVSFFFFLCLFLAETSLPSELQKLMFIRILHKRKAINIKLHNNFLVYFYLGSSDVLITIFQFIFDFVFEVPEVVGIKAGFLLIYLSFIGPYYRVITLQSFPKRWDAQVEES